MQQASWAAAGMLAANDPENPAELASFSLFSLACYPDFLAKLNDVPFLTMQTLQIVEANNANGRALRPEEAVRRVPGLRLEPGHAALWLNEHSLDPRALGFALSIAVQAAGVSIRENTPVLSAEEQGTGIVLNTAQGSFDFDALVVTTGAWASENADPSLHHLPSDSVHPRKGQMLRLRQPEGTNLTTVLRSPSIYIVPRGNGSLIVGATVEDSGFDRTIRDDASSWLLDQASRLWSPFKDLRNDQIEAVWTGLRPVTADQLPVIGSLNHPRVLFATGHYRNGILLAPGTAKLIASLLFHETPPIDLRPFHPSRLLHLTTVEQAAQEAVSL